GCPRRCTARRHSRGRRGPHPGHYSHSTGGPTRGRCVGLLDDRWRSGGFGGGGSYAGSRARAVRAIGLADGARPRGARGRAVKRGSEGRASVECVWLSILLLVPFVYILIAVFDTQRAAFGVSTASRAAARAFLQSPDVATGERRARIAAEIALDDQALHAASV